MNRRKINRLVYTGALLVLFVIGVILWYQQVGSSEMKVFTVIHQKEASFDFKSKFQEAGTIKNPFRGKSGLRCFACSKKYGTIGKIQSNISD